MARVLVLAAAALLACVATVAAHGGMDKHPNMLAEINVKALKVQLDDSITISSSKSKVTNGEFVTVTWSGVSNPSDGDWIGVYSPSNVDMASHVPIKFQFANVSSNYLKTGAGSLQFQLLNLRADYAFAVCRDNLYTPTVVAVSEPVEFDDYNIPFEVHTALGVDHRYMSVMWVTRNASSPAVMWGMAGDELGTRTKATTSTYTADDLCGAPANSTGWRDPGLLHTAVLGPLRPDTVYQYMVGDSAYTWSDRFNFTAPPLPHKERGARFVAFGDMGRGEVDDSIDGKYWKWGNYQPSLWTSNALEKGIDTFDVVLNIGDTSYADGVASEWDEFFHQIEPVARHKPWMTCIGNHELDWPVAFSFFNSTDSQGECGVPQEARFGMPRPDGPQKPWYSFNYGNVHVTMMSTEHHFKAGSQQYDWVMADLKAINASVTPFLIFAGHRPFYVDSDWNPPTFGDDFVAAELRAQYEDALVAVAQRGILVNAIQGHHHTYQRSCVVYKSKCQERSVNGVYRNPQYPVYNVIGMSGAPFTTNFLKKRPAFMEYVDDTHHGFFRINTNATAMHMQFVGTSADGTETVLDEFWMTH